mmetsp:Transcript_12138/g.19147  ORF Transcript_12138/g.19147 Transcript_12138/m.19147 type:complete len:309 (-) Transcript_12138:50-976(-)
MGTSGSRQRGSAADAGTGESTSSSSRRRPGSSSRSSSTRRGENSATGSGGSRSSRQQEGAEPAQHAPTTRAAPKKLPLPLLHQTVTLKNNINLNRNSIHLCKAEDGHETRFQLEFTFDCEAACTLTIWYVAEEEVDDSDATIRFQSNYPHQPTKMEFQPGLGHKYKVPLAEAFDTTLVATRRNLYYHQGSRLYPLVLVLQTTGSVEPQMQLTYATFKGHEGDALTVSAVRQKLQCQGAVYDMKEVYGAEQSSLDTAECVICMSNPKSIAVLPCRHLCMCSDCAKDLHRSMDGCPMCRCKVESLLQMNL